LGLFFGFHNFCFWRVLFYRLYTAYAPFFGIIPLTLCNYFSVDSFQPKPKLSHFILIPFKNWFWHKTRLENANKAKHISLFLCTRSEKKTEFTFSGFKKRNKEDFRADKIVRGIKMPIYQLFHWYFVLFKCGCNRLLRDVDRE